MPAGEGVVEHAFVHAAGLHQRVLDGGSVPYRPSHKSSAVGCAGSGGKGAVKHAAVNKDIVATSTQCSHESAVGAVAVDAAVDGYRTAAARDGQCTMRLAYEACGLLRAGVDGTSDMQFFNRGVLDVAERGAVVFIENILGRTFRKGQRVAAAVERALERVGIACAHHRLDADVPAQFHELAAEGMAIADVAGQRVPVASAADGVGVALGASAGDVTCHVVPASHEESVVVDLHRAVVLHHRAEVAGSGGEDNDLGTLFCAHRLGVVAGRAVCRAAAAHEGGTAGSNGCLAVCRCSGIRGIERMGKVERLAVVQAHEAAAAVGAVVRQQTAGEDAARDGNIAVRIGHEAAVGAVAVLAAMDDGADVAVGERCLAVRPCHKSGSELPGGVDVARHPQVPDDGILDVAERGAVFLVEGTLCRAFREGQRFIVTQESALEGVGLANAHHGRYADVARQLHEQAVEADAVADKQGEDVPVGYAADDVRGALSTFAPEDVVQDHVDGDCRATLAGRATGAAAAASSSPVTILPTRIRIGAYEAII